jgi:hypothetical protein
LPHPNPSPKEKDFKNRCFATFEVLSFGEDLGEATE